MTTMIRKTGLLQPVIEDFFNTDRFFDTDVFKGGSVFSPRWIPAVNILETEKEFKINLVAPGMAKNDFHINMENNMLTISAEKEEEKFKENERFTRKEYTYGSFERTFDLPEYVNGEKIDATYDKGILFITIPKKEEFLKKAKVKEIAVH